VSCRAALIDVGSKRSSQVRFMATVTDHYDDTGEWPTLRLAQNTLAEHHDRSDAKREAQRLSGPLGRWDRESNQVMLTFRGVLRADPNHRLVDDFERALRVLSNRYRHRADARAEATVNIGELAEELSVSDRRARRALGLLGIESLVCVDEDGGERFVIKPEIRHFLRVRGGNAYLRVKARRDRQRCRSRKRRAIREATIPDRAGIRKMLIGALALVLGTGILWLGQQILAQVGL
jgi:DNA-binding transcriptional ArsR family regulator